MNAWSQILKISPSPRTGVGVNSEFHVVIFVPVPLWFCWGWTLAPEQNKLRGYHPVASRRETQSRPTWQGGCGRGTRHSGRRTRAHLQGNQMVMRTVSRLVRDRRQAWRGLGCDWHPQKIVICSLDILKKGVNTDGHMHTHAHTHKICLFP